jgi:hypothetical protein
MPNTLITWACGHFCAAHSTLMSRREVIEAATNDYWFLCDTADDDLANVATDRHVACQKNCPNCQEPIGVSFWRARANEGVRVLRHLHAGSKQMYLETGAQYWGLDFSQKAKHAYDPICASAHEQFWISKTPRLEDPFFAPIDDVLRLSDQADSILKTSKTYWEVKQAFVHINNARAQVGRIIKPLGDLLDGVELVATAQSRSRENKVRKMACRVENP